MSVNDADTVFHEVKTAIKSLSDTGIKEYVNQLDGGLDGLLNLVFSQLPGSFLPEKAGKNAVSFQYEILAEDGPRFYYADIADGSCVAGPGQLPAPRVTMTMEIPVFLQVMTGVLAPVRAFLGRRIKVKGDMMAATKFESWFARP